MNVERKVFGLKGGRFKARFNRIIAETGSGARSRSKSANRSPSPAVIRENHAKGGFGVNPKPCPRNKDITIVEVSKTRILVILVKDIRIKDIRNFDNYKKVKSTKK